MVEGDGLSADFLASGVANAVVESAGGDPGRDLTGLAATAEVATNATIEHAAGDIVRVLVVVVGVEGELTLQHGLRGAAVLVGDVMAAVRAVVGAEWKATNVVAELAVVLAGVRARSNGRLGVDWN